MAHSMDQKPPKMAKIETKKEVKVSFKVTLLQNDSRYTAMCLFNEIEVQRFVIPKVAGLSEGNNWVSFRRTY